MTTCANCPADAIVEYPISGDVRVFYCENHIPTFLLKPEYKRRLNYNVNVLAPVAEEPVVEEPVKKKTSKTSTEETPITKTPAEAEGE
jgi:hypothetical protein